MADVRRIQKTCSMLCFHVNDSIEMVLIDWDVLSAWMRFQNPCI